MGAVSRILERSRSDSFDWLGVLPVKLISRNERKREKCPSERQASERPDSGVPLTRLMPSKAITPLLFVKSKPLPQNRSHVTHQFIHRPLILGPVGRSSWLHPGLEEMPPGQSDRTEAVPPDTESQTQPATTVVPSEGKLPRRQHRIRSWQTCPPQDLADGSTAARPQSQKQPSTRHDGLGNDVKGKECGHRLRKASWPRKGPTRMGGPTARFSSTEYDP